MSTVIRFKATLRLCHTSGVMWRETMFNRIRANILPVAKRIDITR